jgi:hypothetical protein
MTGTDSRSSRSCRSSDAPGSPRRSKSS